MFKKPAPEEDPALNGAIASLYEELSTHQPESKDYAAIADQITKLYALKPEKPKGVSKETMAIIAGNLAGILLIVGYEHAHVVTSKALGFILKAR